METLEWNKGMEMWTEVTGWKCSKNVTTGMKIREINLGEVENVGKGN